VQETDVVATGVEVVVGVVVLDVVFELDELPQPPSSTAPMSAAIIHRVAIGPKGSWC
jgi:hypothetical protein